ncbi:MAG: hypothetical protein AUJ12_09980 [Alphaproteobacteria bacterium CG1_02_46_17]|nr:MAG: hypothetical protein AUJ12_09980 [Alphaproteobacteria bacterium CG1_02_46_17]
MGLFLSIPIKALLGLGFLSLLTGCTGDVVDLDSPAHQQLLENDRQEQTQYEGQMIRLDLTKALDRAVEMNLDARVAALDMVVKDGNLTMKELEVLPQVKSSRTTMIRSDLGASSSRSIQSGLQSLEPSQSSDRRRMVGEMQASWNLLDAGLALAETYRLQDESAITRERYVKVVQNIERDVYAAYWRAWEYQQTKTQTANIIASSNRQIGNLSKAIDKNLLSSDEGSQKISELSDRQKTLREMDQILSSADIELKALLSYPQSVTLELEAPPSVRSDIQALLAGKIPNQEWSALKSRPELREEVLNKNIAIKSVREEIFKTFPGAQLLFSYNNDSNSFLQEKQWSNFSFGLTQNILNVLTLPMRFQAAKDKERQADAHRQALEAALLAQVHLGRQSLAQSLILCRDAERSAVNVANRAYAKTQKSKTGFAAGGEAVLAKLDSQIGAMARATACTNMQDSYAALINSLGRHIDHQTLMVAEMNASPVQPPQLGGQHGQ